MSMALKAEDKLYSELVLFRFFVFFPELLGKKYLEGLIKTVQKSPSSSGKIAENGK